MTEIAPRSGFGWMRLLLVASLVATVASLVVAPALPADATVVPPQPSTRPVTSISSGHYATCAIRTSGALACWGRENGPSAGLLTDVPSGGFREVSLSFSLNTACAIRADRTLACWGDNRSGVQAVPAGTFISVTAAGYQACGVRTDRSIVCWGTPDPSATGNDAGNGPAADLRTFPPNTLLSRSGWDYVTAFGSHACAHSAPGFTIDGTTYRNVFQCWGDNSANAVGDGLLRVDIPGVQSGYKSTCILPASGTFASGYCQGQVAWGLANEPPSGTFARLAYQEWTACALAADGAASCWGKIGPNPSSACSITSCSFPPASARFLDVAPGGQHVCGVRTDNTLLCWGDTVGDPAARPANTPSGTFAAPIVTTHPMSQTKTSARTVTFTAAADGPSYMTVRWQVSTNGGSTWSDIPGATSDSYSFSVSASQNGYRYRTIYTAGPGSATTNAAILTVDSIFPALSVTHTVDGLNGYNVTSPVTLRITASDASGLAGKPTCTDNGDPLTVTGTSSPFSASVSGQGVHSIACSVSDIAENTTNRSDTVRIDTIDPTMSLSHPVDGNDGFNITSPVSETLVAADTGGSGLGAPPTCTDGGASLPLTHPGFQTWVGSVAGNGSHAIACSIRDVAGNTVNGSDTVKIDTVAPTAVVAAPSTVRSPFRVTFSEPVSGISASSLTFTVDGGASPLAGPLDCTRPSGGAVNCSTGPVGEAAFTATSALVPGQTYRVRFNPAGPSITDGPGNAMAGSSQVRAALVVDDSDPGPMFAWPKRSLAAAAGGSYLREEFGGATLRYTFTGTAIRWSTIKGPDQGTATVTISNSSVNGVSVNNYQATQTVGAPVVFSGLPSGKHTITITVDGALGNPAGTGTWVSVDAFTVGGVVTPTPVPKMTWTDGGGFGYRYSAGAGGTMTLTFRGTGASWFALFGPNNGRAKVTIDGVLRGTYDLYDPDFFFAPVTFSGLSDALHTLKITTTGGKNPASSDTVVSVDRIRIE